MTLKRPLHIHHPDEGTVEIDGAAPDYEFNEAAVEELVEHLLHVIACHQSVLMMFSRVSEVKWWKADEKTFHRWLDVFIAWKTEQGEEASPSIPIWTAAMYEVWRLRHGTEA